MGTVISVLATALPVFLALALGMLCRSRNILSREGVDALKKVVLNITLPAVLLNAFATAEYSASTIFIPIVMFAACCVALILGKLIARLFKMKSRLAPFLATGFEAGMIGYALFILLFPEKGTSELAIVDIGHTVFVFTLYKILLAGKTDWKAIGKDMVTSPILWALFVGVIIGATGLYGLMQKVGISSVLDSVTDFIAAPTGMVILLTIGYDLVLKEIPWKKTAGLLIMRLFTMAVMLALVLAVNRYLLGGIIFPGAVVLMCILPPPYVIPVFSDEPEERVYLSSALSAMTLMTVVLFAILSVVYGA